MKRFVAALLCILLLVPMAMAEGTEWECAACGQANNGNFCTNCGARRPENPVCPGCGQVYEHSLGFSFCPACGAPLNGQAMAYEGPGFDTPEAAVQAFLEALREQDLPSALRTFAWETRIQYGSLEGALERNKTWNRSLSPNFPKGSGLLDAMNVELARQYVISSLQYTLLALVNPDLDCMQVYSVNPKEEGSVAAFVAAFDLSRLDVLGTLGDIRILTVQEGVDQGYLPDTALSESLARSVENKRVSYGAEQLELRLAVFTMGGETYLFAPTIVRYADRWYLYHTSSEIMSLLDVIAVCIAPLPAAQKR